MEKIKTVLNKILEKLSFLKKYLSLLRGNKRALWGVLAGFLACFVIISAVVGVAIYKNKSQNTFVKVWASVVPYPAAVLRWRIITYSDYIKDLGALEHFYARQQEAAGLPAPADAY
ncbi:MAG: hypothetical protein Q8L21_03170 [Candidatus Komeilibacteria bacterium]|nr:hypothetical protein [Candidatus Komeilibacteria bacterium]